MRKSLLHIAVLLLAVNASAASRLDSLAQRLRLFGERIPQEKVYVHMDNTGYFLGDTIWFAAYTRRTNSDRPSKISRVLYAELWNHDGYLVERKLVEMIDGRGRGFFALPDTLYSGYFELRAYTRWQLNWGQTEHFHPWTRENYFYSRAMAQDFYRDYEKLYSRVFPVYDKPKVEGDFYKDMTFRPLRRYFSSAPPPPELRLSLFPEGGNLVAGVPCRMAFEAATSEGEVREGTLVLRTRNEQLRIKNDNGEEVMSVRTEHRGRGTFTFTPDDASTIKAEAVKTGSAHVDVTYLVAGVPASLFGTEWDSSNTDNLLAEQSDGSFSKTYENVELTASVGIQYKFIINGNWESGDDHVVSISNSGTYNVKFTYYPSDGYGECVAEPVTVNPLVIDVMSITGELTGGWANGDWTNEGAWRDMTQESENVWTLVVTGAEIEAGTYYYKAAANHNWNEYCIPGDGSNKEFTFDESGIYTLKFVANTETDELTLDVEKTGNIVVPDPTLFILGEANDNGWAPNVGVEMTYLDGKFTAEDVTFKGANDGFSYFSFTTKLADNPDDWDYITPFRIGAVSDGDFLVTEELLGQEISLTSDGGQALKIPAGIYTLGVNLETMKLVLTKTGTIDPTAIETVEVETANNVYYNLQGQRVAAPTKGIYIHNGRKVIVK